MPSPLPTIRAGVPAVSKAVYHAIRFLAHDPAVYLTIPTAHHIRRLLIVRDVELERARHLTTVDRVYVPADFAPPEGLSGDREIATAQAAATCLTRHGVRRVMADRSLPLVFAEHLRESGIDVVLDLDLGVAERRRKDETEVAALRQAQRDTESAIAMACQTIRHAPAQSDGVLLHDGQPLTSAIVRTLIDLHLLRLGYANENSIVAGGPIGADCHHPGSGELRTGQPVMIDVFPQNKATLYHGDCTRTVVHGDVPDNVRRMHTTVVAAKKAAEAVTRAGVTGDSVHSATVAVMKAAGVHIGFAPPDAPADLMFLPHGTGHGIGLDLKEPPLLDFKGVELLAGDAVTIEPAVYCRSVGGVRVEDLYVVHDGGADNLNALPEGLTDW
ncbi:MAG TPA: M24 family metallopeptidase [Tepidisphaeraceae bacterium]|jgi:Xaa-Pro aminopeptidase